MTTLSRTLLVIGLLLAPTIAAQAETLLWFDDGLYPIDDQARASYRLRIADERDGIGWPAELRRIRDDALRMRGYVAEPEAGATDATWIGHYELYRMEGEHRLSEVGTTDAESRQQGLATTFDEQGLLDSETLYRDGEIDGEARKYLHGEIYTTTEYENGKREGIHSQYVQGKLRRTEEYHDDQLDGLTKQFSIGSTPALTSRGEYRHGKAHGWMRQYRGGVAISEVHYVDGKQDGPARYWHDKRADQLRELSHYRAGKRVGEQIVRRYDAADRVTVEVILDANSDPITKTEYNPETGQPKSRVRHTTGADDKPRKIHEYFNDDGDLYTRITRFPGQAHEIEVRFDTDGQLTYRRELRGTHRVGRYFETYSPGHTIDIPYDNAGRRDGVQIETIDDKPVRSTTWVQGKRDGRFYEIASNGLRSEGQYVDGQRDGVFRVTAGDQLIESTHYDHGIRDGENVLYADNGAVLDKGRYVDGVKHGAWIESGRGTRRWQGTYDNGERVGSWQAVNQWGYPVETGDYDTDGQRSGLWTMFDDDGRLKACPLYRDGERVEFADTGPDSGQSMVEYCNHRIGAGPDQ